LIEILTDVFGQESEDPIAVLLKQSILATIAPVGVRITQMLAAIQFDGEAWPLAKQINFHATPSIEGNGKLDVQMKLSGCFRQCFESPV
jgi:hypothetical protein